MLEITALHLQTTVANIRSLRYVWANIRQIVRADINTAFTLSGRFVTAFTKIRTIHAIAQKTNLTFFFSVTRKGFPNFTSFRRKAVAFHFFQNSSRVFLNSSGNGSEGLIVI